MFPRPWSTVGAFIPSPNGRPFTHKLPLDLLPQVWIAPAPIRYAKEVLRYRSLLVGIRTKLRNHLGAVLRKRNRRTPGQSLWSRKGRAYVESVALNPEADQIRRESLEQIKALDRLIAG